MTAPDMSCEERLAQATARIAELEAEVEYLRLEMLKGTQFSRLVDWLRSDPIKPAQLAFTDGWERQIAYVLQMDVVPLIERARRVCTGGPEGQA